MQSRDINRLIAVAGGIGAGKSVVCRVLTALGYDVYDCDSRAKSIMDSDQRIISDIAEKISSEAVIDGVIDRQVLARVVFGDPTMLAVLNEIVHAAVRSDLQLWSDQRSGRLRFVETAILYQSGLDKIVDGVWTVTAHDDVRIRRVCQRNNLTPEQVRERIQAQAIDVKDRHKNEWTIINDDCHSVLLQIDNLLMGLKSDSVDC